MENLIKIQNELKVPKGNLNKFGNYKYRSAEDILEAVKPILLKYNELLTLSDEIILVGNKVFLKATARIKDIVSYGYAELSEHKGMSAEQSTGCASSYARKYALGGLFLIDETEQDIDSKKNLSLSEQLEIAKAKIITANSADDLVNKWNTLTNIEKSFEPVVLLAKELKSKFK